MGRCTRKSSRSERSTPLGVMPRFLDGSRGVGACAYRSDTHFVAEGHVPLEIVGRGPMRIEADAVELVAPLAPLGPEGPERLVDGRVVARQPARPRERARPLIADATEVVGHDDRERRLDVAGELTRD